MNSSSWKGLNGSALPRRLARCWLGKDFREVRWLCGAPIPEAGPVLLVVSGRANFLHVVAVAATLTRPVRWVLPAGECRNLWRRWLAARLGVILHGSDAAARAVALREAREALERGEAVALFAQPETARSEALSPSCLEAAKLVVEAESGRAGGPGVVLLPLHLLSSYGATPVPELLITAGPPFETRALLGGASPEASTRTLAGELEDRLTDNPYRLQERDVQFFLADLEKVLRADLEEEWAEKPNWKQKTEGFAISRFIVECVEQLNALDPPRLIGLRIELENYQEELRKWSRHQAEVEAAGPWLHSGPRRTAYWLAALLGFPIALYGFLNHVVPLALLARRSFTRRLADRDPGEVWLLRALVVLGCYIVQVALSQSLWGRAAAGYYALSLPLSGAVLWRYSRLVKTRIRLLYLARILPHGAASLRQLRKSLLQHLNQVRDEFAEESLSVRSPGSGV